MRKIYTFITTLAIGTLTSQAEIVQDYVQDFESSITLNSKEFKLPGSWEHFAEGYVGDNNTYYPTYTHNSNKGINGSKCIQVSDQSNVGSYNDGWGSSYDLIVTPEVSGEISIAYKKQNSYSSGCFIEFYYLNQEGDTYSRGNLIEVNMPELTNQDFSTITFTLDTPQRIGIRASYGYIDHFTASVADVEKRKEIKITNCKNLTEGGGKPICNEFNKFTVKAQVTIENTGEADITADDADATISLCHSETYSDPSPIILSTMPIGVAIPAGESVTVNIEAEVDGNIYGERASYGVRDNLSGSYEFCAWITPNLYKPQLQLLRHDNSLVNENDVNNGKFTVDFGHVNATTTKKYFIKNIGAAPMTVKSIDVPEGISVSAQTFTVNYNEQQEIGITINDNQPSEINGDIVINADGMDAVTLHVKGTMLDATKYYVSFEDGKFPTDMIVIGPKTSSRWSIKDCSSSDKDAPDNNFWLANSTDNLDNHDRLITPLLEFGENETIGMDVFKMSQSESCTSQVSVLYSTDRVNWNVAKTLTAEEMNNPTGAYSNIKVVATPLAATIPVGQYYIAIDCNYVYIDDIYGGKVVDVTSNLYPTIAKAPADGMVNYEYQATANILNLMPEATTAEVSLIVNGDKRGSQTLSIEGNQSISATVAFLADQTLEDAEAYFTVSDGNIEFMTDSWALNIQPEVMIAESEVQSNETTNKANSPFWTNWYRTQSETIYPAESLTLKNGDAINNISFVGYTSASAKKLKMKVWIANTEDNAPDIDSPTEFADMTLVADEYPVALEAIGSNSDSHHKLFTIQFDEPFIYTGGNLRIKTFTLLDEYCNGTAFMTGNDETLSKNSMYRNDDNKTFDEEMTKSWSKTNAPIVIFGIEVEPVEISGVVTSIKEEGTTPLAGAIVTLKALANQTGTLSYTEEGFEEGSESEVIEEPYTVTYTATTDENGFYTVKVLQPALSYKLSSVAADHFNYSHAEIITPSESNKEINFGMNYDVNSSITDIYETSVDNCEIYNMQGIRLNVEKEQLTPGLYIVNGKKTIIR